MRIAALLLGLTLLAYLPVLRGGYIWDDDDYVTTNTAIRTPAGLVDIWLHPHATPQYYPLVFTSFWIEHALWDFHPAGYHIVNVLLHAGVAILLWRLLIELKLPPRAALLAACIFAVHPMNAESVAWITERKNVLSAVFYFASALTFLRGRHALSLLLFVCALLSKSVTCSLPAALLLVIWWKRDSLPPRREAITLAAMFVLGLGLAINTALLERSNVKAVGAEWNYSAIDRILIAGRAVWFYAAKILLPIQLSFVYPKWVIVPSALWQWMFPLGMIVALTALWVQRDRWGRGPLVAALFFVGTLVPALGFFNIYPMRYTFVADHYAYIASVGLIVPLAALVARHAYRPATFRSVSVTLMVLLIPLTMNRTWVLADVERLWSDTLAKNPDSWMVNLNLAKVLDSGELFERQAELGASVADAQMDYGTYLANHGRFDEAMVRYQRALELNPDLAQIHYRLARTYHRMGRLDEAMAEYRRQLEVRSDFAPAHWWYAQALYKSGRVAEAWDERLKARALDPTLEEQMKDRGE